MLLWAPLKSSRVASYAHCLGSRLLKRAVIAWRTRLHWYVAQPDDFGHIILENLKLRIRDHGLGAVTRGYIYIDRKPKSILNKEQSVPNSSALNDGIRSRLSNKNAMMTLTMTQLSAVVRTKDREAL